jgi:signal transduction histidine kinase
VGGGLAIHGLLAAVSSAYLVLLGAGWPNLVTLWLIWLVAVGGYYGWHYAAYRSYYRELLGTLHGLERKHLLGSLSSEPPLPELVPLWEAMVEVARSVANEVALTEQEAIAHREYVEGWVHEVKAPIAAARLMAESGDRPADHDLIQELDRIEQLVEQALFYARSSAVSQDYFVRETTLEEPVKSVLRRLARPFIAHRVAVTLEGLDLTVFTDRKWLEFVLMQILTNALKYRRDREAAVRIWAETQHDGVILCIEDNGIGIPRADLGRIFEKGFTGANGRRYERSTGMGLFLARKLCLALGHGIAAESAEGRYTRATISFPKGRLLRPAYQATPSGPQRLPATQRTPTQDDVDHTAEKPAHLPGPDAPQPGRHEHDDGAERLRVERGLGRGHGAGGNPDRARRVRRPGHRPARVRPRRGRPCLVADRYDQTQRVSTLSRRQPFD